MGSGDNFSSTLPSYSLFVERVNTSDMFTNNERKEFAYFSIAGTELDEEDINEEIFPKVKT